MTWVKLVDTFPDHPKVLAAGDHAAWLWVSGLCFSSRHLTDGFIPASALARLTGLPKPRQLAARLVEHGLWDEVEGGWRVHNYTEKQRSRNVVEGEREATRERVKKHRDQRKGNGVTNGQVTPSEVETEQEEITPLVPPSSATPLPPPNPTALEQLRRSRFEKRADA